MRPGKFIVIDGPEGAGKTTIVSRLAEEFPHIVRAYEPGGTPIGEAVRTEMKSPERAPSFLPNEKLISFWAARASFLAHVIRPALEEEKIVIVDRLDPSTFAYQVKAEGASEGLFWAIRKEILHSSGLIPNRYLFIDCDPVIGQERCRSRAGAADYYDSKGIEFFHTLREGYEEFFRKARASYSIVDGSINDPNAVYERVRSKLLGLLRA